MTPHRDWHRSTTQEAPHTQPEAERGWLKAVALFCLGAGVSSGYGFAQGAIIPSIFALAIGCSGLLVLSSMQWLEG
ncbi:hypothetical protein Pan44_45800 [Caulifigura coniformis]|uniref:Uncharacterized protein n=1 Tax=Caulifigura coniformis TaxID=2527983 RepID=A0A517SK72_9PLAN|nr:hypothetical protein [Caulifigura coniformis]QDT56525.1 hypothetical protein Pan44_45800 [Caulifigura coniformis]